MSAIRGVRVDFEFSSEQEMLRASVRAFLADKAPIAAVRSAYAAPSFDPAVWDGLVALGVTELDSMVDAAVVLEEMGRAVCPAPFASALVARSLVPGRAGRGTVAVRDDHVPDAVGADWFVVVRDDGLFVADGGSVTPEASVDGSRKLGRVTFDGVTMEPLDVSPHVAIDRLGVALAVDAVGAAQRALELSVEYAKEREQFGKPIGSFQAVQHLCAEMLRDVELGRAAAYYACWALDDASAEEAHRAATLARAFAADAFPRVGATAIQVFGGIGFTWEHDIHLYYKRLLSQSVLLGPASTHLETLATLAIP